MRIENPYHEGELRVQERLGELDEGRRNGRAIADTILAGAFEFVEQLPFAVLGSTDPQGAAWTSIVFGNPGFARVRDERRIEVALERSVVHPDDPWLANLASDPRFGSLFIDLGTRRRLRINGTSERQGQRLSLMVAEAYPNCPKYIQRRQLRTSVRSSDARAGEVRRGSSFGPAELALVASADTLFVASSNPSGGVDASHRGGPPGFVEVLDERSLRIPDYPGNHMYSTLGNFVVNPRTGLTFLDFESGRLLLTTGRAQIVWNQAGNEARTVGTNRFWDFTVEGWISYELPVQLAWELLDTSPFNPT